MAGRLRRDVIPPVDDAAVVVQDLHRRFADRLVLDGLNLTIRPGEFVVMLGRSGSGKSTFLRTLAGLDGGIEGLVRVPARRAVVFQDARLMPWKRVLANVVVGLRDADARSVGRATLAEVGLSGRERAWPVTLSGGEAQRTSLARALVRRPQLLLLDEPFGALDALTRIRMQDLLGQVYRHHRPAVLLVTHDVDEAIALADRILVLSDGHIGYDQRVDVPRPRTRAGPEFAHLRRVLLAELGVFEDSHS